MPTLTRIPENPILGPDASHEWEHDGAFNGCVVEVDGTYHMVYRALSAPRKQNGVTLQVSSIGYASSPDGIHFGEHRQLFEPTEDWEIYGCEDPRITFMDGKFYIFYTALSVYPFAAYGIKLAVAITTDFKTFEKHPVTTFNSKAMGMFPEKVGGKYAALLTIHTDLPPAKIALALFDTEEDMWSETYWSEWYEEANTHIIHLLRDMNDHVELGAPPLKTKDGWLVVYSYIKKYLSDDKEFGIEAVLLDLENPRVILGRTEFPLLSPEEDYELEGVVPNVVFPSGALVKEGRLYVYYGAADTHCAAATRDLNALLDELRPIEDTNDEPTDKDAKKFIRFSGNPILTASLELDWQALAVYNPAAIYLDGKVHIVYRGQAKNGISYFGYASSKDGLHIDEDLDYPIYSPREDFEKSDHDGNSGCEDPRISLINDRIYMTYTAYDGANPPRVALTSIALDDFLAKKWDWDKPRLISPPGADDKDACIIKRVKNEGYLAFHRLGSAIWIDFLRDLDFPEKKYLTGGILAEPRPDSWDNVKVGISAPPLETEQGWLLLYHGVSNPGNFYKVGAMLLDYENPRNILGRTAEPIFEPQTQYELQGQVPNVVFPCGAAIIEGVVYLYYGGADSVVGVATMPLQNLLDLLMKK